MIEMIFDREVPRSKSSCVLVQDDPVGYLLRVISFREETVEPQVLLELPGATAGAVERVEFMVWKLKDTSVQALLFLNANYRL